MSHGFKLRFDQMRESDPTGQHTSLHATDSVNVYPSPGHTRNLCLMWPDGRCFFLNYAYLVAGEFDPQDEKNVIRLSFSSHTAVLKGYSLQALFMALFDHMPRLIYAVEERYVLEEDRKESIVVEMVVEKNES